MDLTDIRVITDIMDMSVITVIMVITFYTHPPNVFTFSFLLEQKVFKPIIILEKPSVLV